MKTGADVQVGDEVVVYVPLYEGEVVAAVVTAAARVWLTVEEKGEKRHRAWRMRRDTQGPGTSSNSRGRFYTMEQWAERARLSEASEILRGAGIYTGFGSKFGDGERRIALAEFVKAILSQEES